MKVSVCDVCMASAGTLRKATWNCSRKVGTAFLRWNACEKHKNHCGELSIEGLADMLVKARDNYYKGVGI